jgi:ribosomal protein S12 methylthiotransferase
LKLLETIAAYSRLAKYLDIPLQHASRSVLARMKRGSNADAFLKMLEKIRKTIPGVSIRTSFIVGFPGETEDEFRELCDFVKAAEFDWMGVFSYSDEDAAKSFRCENKVDAKTIARRRATLMSIQKKISARKLREQVGQKMEVLLEGPSKDTDLIWEARHEGMAPEIDGKIYITDFEGVNDAADLPAPGTLATVEITESNDYDLIARAVEFSAPPTAAIAASGPVRIASPAKNPFPILTSR